jgi:hypothetical protein
VQVNVGDGDRRIIRLIQKWLKAGILEDGVVTGSAAVGTALFVGFPATMAESDFSRPCIIGYGSSPWRAIASG